MHSIKKVLVLGKIPPPIGGVTIHVKRLLEHFNSQDLDLVYFLDLKQSTFLGKVTNVFRFKILHLHTSNVYFRLLMSVFCLATFKKLIITVHGNLGRYNRLKNIFDYISVSLCYIPIVLNSESFVISKQINRRSLFITAFVPPLNSKPLNADLLSKINFLKKNYDYIFCTNAFNLTQDKNGTEIYGVVQLINIFNNIFRQALIISDPSGAYYRYCQNNGITVSDNILIIPYEHEFIEVIKLSDVFIRNTSTDGDSLSVNEALFLNKTVFATNSVPRPDGCMLYSRLEPDLLQSLIVKFKNLSENKNHIVESCFPQLSGLYTQLLKT
jgi:glycosyltransferase involved in cell wall biosynthesis